MAQQLLLKTQRNDIFNTIRQEALDPSEFEWDERPSTRMPNLTISALVHSPTGYYFEFDFYEAYDERGRATTYSPGYDEAQESFTIELPGWGAQLDTAKRWLQNLKREIHSSDLWATISQEKQLVEAASTPGADNTSFSPQEQQYITTQLDEVKEYLFKTQNLSSQHKDYVSARLNYLADAAKRQGRQDWMHTAIGVLFSIVVGVALAPDAARELFRFAASVLNQLFGGSPLLPQ